MPKFEIDRYLLCYETLVIEAEDKVQALEQLLQGGYMENEDGIKAIDPFEEKGMDLDSFTGEQIKLMKKSPVLKHYVEEDRLLSIKGITQVEE